jgi:cyclic beta-1,2-glucan synthetase
MDHVAIQADLSGAETVRAVSARIINFQEKLHTPERTEEIQPVTQPFFCACPEQELSYFYNDDNSFTFKVSGKLPHNSWGHMLANETFGYFATDAGTGHMWYMNARENKINRWLNDSLAAIGTERLELHRNGVRYSLFASADG